RINEVGSLGEGLSVILDPIEYALWESTADTPKLLRELDEALAAPPARRNRPALPRPGEPGPHPTRVLGAEQLEAAGGAVPLDSAFYVRRESDADFLSAVHRRDSIVLVKGARQMGKSSLLARALQGAREEGMRVALTDF